MIPTAAEKLQIKSIAAPLLFLFFLSGMCGLIYQVVWLRMLGLFFGNTTYATSAVLSGFMAGLGFGALYFGRRIDREGNPVRVYGLLEGGVGVYSLLTPLLWKLVEWISVLFYQSFSPPFLTGILFKFILAFLFLIVPTFLMGGTLPVLTKYFVTEHRDLARKVSLLYALNTFGAVLGVILSGFFLLYLIGVWQTTVLAGCLNLLICFLCLKFENKTPIAAKPNQSEEKEPVKTVDLRTAGLLTLFGVSGALSMVYEIGWTRVLAIVLGSSVYAFSVMLASFLLGIALGSYAFSFLARKYQIDLWVFAVLQVFTAVFVIAGLNQFDDMPFYFLQIFRSVKGEMWAVECGKFVLCAVVMLPPTFCIGAMFACFIHVYSKSEYVGQYVGVAYFANTIGTILGSVATAFVLIPALGIQNSLFIAALTNVSIGILTTVFFWRCAGRLKFVTAICMASVFFLGFKWVEPWNKCLITSGIVVTPVKALGMDRTELNRQIETRQELFYKEGVGATVSVTRTNDLIAMSVNGKVEASNSKDAFNQYLLGHLPLLMKSGAKKVLIIGLGSGSTNAAVASYPVERIDGIEIEKAVADGASYFKLLNRNVLQDPRHKLWIEDGRNFLLVHPELYDVIISEPSNPWMAGVANLFSWEHYQLMRKRLNTDGIVCQWLHAYSMSPDDVRMIIRTFTKSFEHTSLWTSQFPDLLLIGSRQPISIDFPHVQEMWKNPEIRKDFGFGGSRDPEPEIFFSSFWLSDEELRKLAGSGKINRDNFPYLEFSAPRYLYKDTQTENYLMINSFRSAKYPAISSLIPSIEGNQKFHNGVARGYAAKLMFQEAAQELKLSEAINPEDAHFLFVTGVLNFALENVDWALDYFNKSILQDPQFAEAHYYRGLNLLRKQQPAQAAEAFRRAVAILKENPFYLLQLANELMTAGELEKALELYRSINELQWDGQVGYRFEARKAICGLLIRLGKRDEAIQSVQAAIEEYPKHLEFYILMGEILENQRKFSEAIAIYKKLQSEFPQEVRNYINLARVYDEMGMTGESIKALKELVRRDKSLANHPEIKKALSRK